jgi:hypothetical protein
MSFLLTEIPPGRRIFRAPRAGESFIYIVDGLLKVAVGPEQVSAGCGDSLHYEGSQAIEILNSGPEISRFIWAESPRREV